MRPKATSTREAWGKSSGADPTEKKPRVAPRARLFPRISADTICLELAGGRGGLTAPGMSPRFPALAAGRKEGEDPRQTKSSAQEALFALVRDDLQLLEETLRVGPPPRGNGLTFLSSTSSSPLPGTLRASWMCAALRGCRVLSPPVAPLPGKGPENHHLSSH